MSDARRLIFDRVKTALAGVADKQPLPDYPADVALTLGARAPGDPVATLPRAAGVGPWPRLHRRRARWAAG